MVWFLAPPVSLGTTFDRESIAAALGVSPEDIEARFPIQQISAGISALIVPLCSLDALRRSKVDLNAIAALGAGGPALLAYLFCRQTHTPQNHLCARFFFEAHGVREDPATGNGAAFLGERHCVGGGRTLAAEKRPPVVIEIRKAGRYVDGSDLHAFQSRVGEENLERLRAAQRETNAFVHLCGARIELDRRVPEVPHELHLAGVIPNAPIPARSSKGRAMRAWRNCLSDCCLMPPTF